MEAEGVEGEGRAERAAFRTIGLDTCQGSAQGKRAPAVLMKLQDSALLFFTRHATHKETEFPVSPAGKGAYFHSHWETQASHSQNITA